MSLPEPARLAWTAADPGPAASWGPPQLAAQQVAADEMSPTEQAYQRGFDDGYAEGLARGAERIEPSRRALGELIAEVERQLAVVRLGAEANVTALALVVARWLFQRDVESDSATLEALVRRAVALLPAGAPIEISMHPADLDQLTGQLELKEPDGRPLIVHWVRDASLDRGSFRLIGPERLVDGRVDVALRSLYERLASQ